MLLWTRCGYSSVLLAVTQQAATHHAEAVEERAQQHPVLALSTREQRQPPPEHLLACKCEQHVKKQGLSGCQPIHLSQPAHTSTESWR